MPDTVYICAYVCGVCACLSACSGQARKAQLAEAEAAQKTRGEDASAAAVKNRQSRQQHLQGKGKGQNQGGGGGGGSPTPNWAVGVLCDAQYTDGQWYAAKITEKVGKGKWKIL